MKIDLLRSLLCILLMKWKTGRHKHTRTAAALKIRHTLKCTVYVLTFYFSLSIFVFCKLTITESAQCRTNIKFSFRPKHQTMKFIASFEMLNSVGLNSNFIFFFYFALSVENLLTAVKSIHTQHFYAEKYLCMLPSTAATAACKPLDS